jgi:uncharacterized protein with NRDE domain
MFILIKGQDQTLAREGGTWLALNVVQSRIGVLLNLPSHLRENNKGNAQSRGFLVPNFLTNLERNLDTYIDELQTTKSTYTGFNFIGLERKMNSQ